MSDGDVTALTMPKWGMAMREGKIVSWLKEEGGPVAVGDEIYEIETEKIVNVVEAESDGVLARRVAAVGELLPVGALLGVLAEPGTADERVNAFVEEYQRHFEAVTAETAAAASVEPAEVDVGGQKMRYLELGSGETTIVLIHGLGGDLNGWLFNQPVLAEDYRVVALDLPCHGGSAKAVENGSLRELAATASGSLDAAGVEYAHFVGHSLGGAVAVQLAAAEPQRVQSLTLIGSAGAGTPVSRSYIDGFIAANHRRDIKPLLQQLFANPSLVNRDLINDVLKAKRFEGVESCWRKLAEAAIFAVEGDDPAVALDRLSMPVQLIWGKEDQIATMPERARLPSAVTVHVLDGTGHMPQLEAASEVNRLIKAIVGNA